MFRRSRKQPCKPSRKKPLRKKPNGSGKRCLTLTRIAVSASIPLMIAIFTVVTYVQQQQISKHHRLQDQQIANETRLKDLQIANLTRIHDNQIAEKQREQDQQLADDLHYQTVYNKYIEDVSNVLYEQHQSSSFVDADKFQYIRSKTVTTLRDIDSAHKTYLFMFLYDNNLLPSILDNSTVDLSGSDLRNIHIDSSATIQYNFKNIYLRSVNLLNASFINCAFYGSQFVGSVMTNVNLSGSTFYCSTTETIISKTSLEHADFRKITMCNGIFVDADLSYSNFSEATITDTLFIGTSLVYSDFSRALFYISVHFINTNLTGAILNTSVTDGIQVLKNVVLPDGTWRITSGRNLVKNGDAEKEVTGDYATALHYFAKALEINLSSIHHYIASTYDNIGLIYTKMGDDSRAIDYYNIALDIRLKCLPLNHPDLNKSFEHWTG